MTKKFNKEEMNRITNICDLLNCGLFILKDLDSLKGIIVEKLMEKYFNSPNLSVDVNIPKIKEVFSEIVDISFGQGEKMLELLERLLKHDGDIAIDLDGTLTAFKYAEDHLLPCRDDQINDYSITNNIYEKARALKCMQFIVKNLPKEKVYILTRTEPNLVEKKNAFINANFDILPGHIIHVQDAKNKLNELEKLHIKSGKKVIFIEDTFKSILDAEELFDFIIGIHISEFIF